MEKSIALILIILLVLLLVSCNFDNDIGFDGYSKISDEDIPIINTISSKFDYSLTQYDKPMEENFVTKIDNIKVSTHSFYSAHIDADTLYYICGYGVKSVSTMMYMTIGDYPIFYSWYRVDDIDNVRQEINNKELLHIFAVCDATIEKDLVDGIKHDYKTKYYSKQNANKLEPYELSWDSFILFGKKSFIEQESAPYINASILNDGYTMYIDKNGVEYLSFLHEYYNESDFSTQNFSRELFLNYYDDLCNYFVPLDELSEEFYHEEQKITKKFAGIEVEKLIDVIIK